MIKKINYNALLKDYFDILTEIEFGKHYKNTNEYKTALMERLKKNDNNNASYFGYYKKGNIPCGIVTVVERTNISFANDSEILQIGVKEKYRRNQIGESLLHYVEHYYRKKGVRFIFVNTYAGDYGVIHFYGKNGYAPVAVIPETNGKNDEGTIVMRKKL